MLQKLKQFSLPEIEEKVLKFWKTNRIFERSLAVRQVRQAHRKQAKGNKKKFVFYEGPPTANGRPGIHHVLARAFKDIIPRYKTMRGYFVPRKGGWDTHGLPVELEVERQLGLKSKKEIEKYGIAAFNKKCKESVWKYKDEWEKLTERIGFWLDLKNPYITYENSYIETLWWIFKQIWEKRLLYKGHKVVPWCTRCGTALSSHEIALGYKEVEDTSVYVKFKIKNYESRIKNQEFKNTYILSWTTTPWTLPGNVALAISSKIDYVKIKAGTAFYILAKERLSVFSEPYEIVKEFKGKELVGLNYEPLFKIKPLTHKNSYKIYPASFVTTSEGTGVVHTAMMYGVDDYELGRKVGLPQYHTVDERGKFTKDVLGFTGLYVKDKKTEEKIINYLQASNFLLRTEQHTHEYPFCWRCDTPLLYYARESWFIAMSKLRSALLKENEKINWIPASIKKGRFGEWLKEAKDWAISRERYWGTPLPIWECKNCNHTQTIGSFEELSNLQGKQKNRYLFMRHGESVMNLKDTMNSDPKYKDKYPLTLRGRRDAEKAARRLIGEKIDLIISSDFRRTKETAQIVAQTVGIKKVLYDKRFREIFTGVRDGRSQREYHNFFSSPIEKFSKPYPSGETLREVGKRVFAGLSDLEKKYKGKTVLIVSHEYPIWMAETTMRSWTEEQSVKEKEKRGDFFVKPAEWRETLLFNLPRNEFNFVDPHRPYIDEVTFKCGKCGGKMKRIKEVADVWFDSGAMPFASQMSDVKRQMSEIRYPADYIAEGIDQTRGWFYTLLAIGVLLNKGTSYKNVVSLGLILDKYGQKMSKSKGNIVDPWTVIAKYGADAVRWYFYTVNPPGEPKLFNEADLGKTVRQFFLILYNCFVFYKTYAQKNLKPKTNNLKPVHILDKWITARLNETIAEATRKLDKYEIGEAARTIEIFVQDLSRWYIRRSRRRFQKPTSLSDCKAASATLGFVLLEISKLLAPFTPFFSEALYKALNNESRIKNQESVHLEEWSAANSKFKMQNAKLLKQMEEIRRLASLVLAKRAEVGIKVRQPLRMLKVRSSKLSSKHLTSDTKQLLDILKEEVNVKEVVFNPQIKEEIELDTEITHELKEEGWLREFIRVVQDMRQDAKLEPKNIIALFVEAPEELRYVLQKNEKFFKKEINARIISYKRSQKFSAKRRIELETKLGDWAIWLAIDKIK